MAGPMAEVVWPRCAQDLPHIDSQPSVGHEVGAEFCLDSNEGGLTLENFIESLSTRAPTDGN